MIVVLGSVNMDLTFQLPRLPDVGETVLTPTFSEAVGGKGANQAIAAARDGARTQFYGAVGSDGFGVTAKSVLAAAGVETTGVATVPGATGLAMILVDPEGRNKIAVASGANTAVCAASIDPALLDPASTLVLQMEIPVAETEIAISAAHAAGARIILNLAPALPIAEDALRRVSVLVVNEHEATTLAAALSVSASEPETQARALSRRLGNTVIVTLGAEGAAAAKGGDGDQSLVHVPALAVNVVDTTGAGDCFVGVLAGALAGGLALPDAMRRAAVAGSLACRVVGAAPSFPERSTIDAAIAETRS